MLLGVGMVFTGMAAPPYSLREKDWQKAGRQARKGNVAAMLWLADYYTVRVPNDTLQAYWYGQAALRGDTLVWKGGRARI